MITIHAIEEIFPEVPSLEKGATKGCYMFVNRADSISNAVFLSHKECQPAHQPLHHRGQ